MTKDILDEDWEHEDDELYEDAQENKEDAEVVMIKTFNSENEANIYAAALANEGINTQVVGNTTGVMTPFDYANVRLYVAESQSHEALNFIKQMDAANALREKPQFSSGAILVVIIVALMVLSAIIRIFQMR